MTDKTCAICHQKIIPGHRYARYKPGILVHMSCWSRVEDVMEGFRAGVAYGRAHPERTKRRKEGK